MKLLQTSTLLMLKMNCNVRTDGESNLAKKEITGIILKKYERILTLRPSKKIDTILLCIDSCINIIDGGPERT